MRYVIAKSYDPHEVNCYFLSKTVPRIGKLIQRNGRYYKIVDIECVLDAEGWDPTEVRVKIVRVT